MNTNSMKHIISLLLLPAACVREDEMAQKSDIRLTASLIPSGIMTRGEGVLDPHYGKELTIGMARIDERVTPGYPLFDNTAGQLKAVMKPGRGDTNSRDISFVDSFQQFLDVNSNIKFASWYPFGDSSYNARRKSVSTPIDGTTDILYGSVAYYLVWTNSSSDDGSLVYTYKDSGNVRNPGVKEIPRYGIYLTRNTFDRTWYPYTGYIDSYDGTKDIMVSDVREAQYWPPPLAGQQPQRHPQRRVGLPPALRCQ